MNKNQYSKLRKIHAYFLYIIFATIAFVIGVILIDNDGFVYAVFAVIVFVYAFFMIGVGVYQFKKVIIRREEKTT